MLLILNLELLLEHAGNNPAAQAMIMAQSLEAKNKVLGEQTRINQVNKMQTYDKNRAFVK